MCTFIACPNMFPVLKVNLLGQSIQNHLITLMLMVMRIGHGFLSCFQGCSRCSSRCLRGYFCCYK
ncbi:unnamed protein product [Prunus brigantina]